MSYILDALRKSEQERQRGTPPGLATTHVPPRAGKGGRAVWPWLLAAALLTNAGVLVWWLEPWKGKAPTGPVAESRTATPVPPDKASVSAGDRGAKESEAPPVLAEKRQTGPQGASGRGSPPSPEDARGADGSKSSTGLGRKPADRPADVAARPGGPVPSGAAAPKMGQAKAGEPVKADPSLPGGSPAVQAALPNRAGEPSKTEEPRRPAPQPSQATAPAAAAPPAPLGPPTGASDSGLMEDLKPLISETRPTRKEPDFRQIPASLRNTIPKISLSFLVYSDKPSERRVTINGKVLREGDEVAEGLKLEQITQEGAVLSYRGFQFHKGVF